MTMRQWMKNRIVSVVMSLVIFTSALSGCNVMASETEIDTEAIADAIIEELQAEIEDFSVNWEDYIGDTETFVYGLLTNQLEYQYNVFPGYVELSDGTMVYGLAYSDYSECYTDEDEEHTYFAAGMMTFCGETEIPQSEFDEGLIIHSLDYEDDDFSFFLKYASEEFKQHCVIYDKYVTYGVDENGSIFYDTQAYERGTCDEEIGSLYSYDEARYVFDLEFGAYEPITGDSLSAEVDYDELEILINEYLEKQDVNFVQTDIVNNVYFAQEAVTSYLLSLQEETFMGYDVDALVEAAENLDPMECFRITEEGVQIIEVTGIPDTSEIDLAKWLVGTSCVIVTAVGLVTSVVCIECPPLAAAAGAVTGAAIDIFMQVVISDVELSDVQWSKVALSAVTGAIAGFAGPYIQTIANNPAVTFIADTTLDALLGGIEYTVAAWLDGEEGIELAKKFGEGFALGFALSGAFKAVGDVAGKAVSKLAQEISPATKKIFPKLTQKVSVVVKKTTGFLGNLKAVVDDSIFHSKYIANKMAFRQLYKIIDAGDEILQKKSFDELATKVIDVEGKSVNKDTLLQLFKNADDGTVLAFIKVGDETIDVVKQSGMVGILFDGKYQTVNIGRIVNDRDSNFIVAANEYIKLWKSDPTQIPTSIKNAMDISGINVKDMEPRRLVAIVKNKNNGWVFHENIDLQTITLVPRDIHAEVSHMGGFGLAKYLKVHMGREFFERFLMTASSDVVNAIG